MTIEQFNSTRWGAGMKVLCQPLNMGYEAYVADIVCVNLDQALIAVADEDSDDMESWSWYRCENCEIVLENPEKEER